MCGKRLCDAVFLILCIADIITADEMVPLLSCRLGSLTASECPVCPHALADMDPAVVDEVHLHDLCTLAFQHFAHSHAEAVVPHMTKVKRFVRVRAGKLDHDPASFHIIASAVGITFSKDPVMKQ